MDSRITIGILNHDESVFKKYIANSLKNLKGEFETIIIKNSKPAEAYNEIIRQSKNKYIPVDVFDTVFECFHQSIKLPRNHSDQKNHKKQQKSH